MNSRIIFTYDTATGSLWLSRESSKNVPVFDPTNIMETLRTLSASEQPVDSVVQVKLNNHKTYSMKVTSEEPRKKLDVQLTEI